MVTIKKKKSTFSLMFLENMEIKEAEGNSFKKKKQKKKRPGVWLLGVVQ